MSMCDDKLEDFSFCHVQSFEQYCTNFLGLPSRTPASTEAAIDSLSQGCDEYIQRDSKYNTRNALLTLDKLAGLIRWVSPRGGAGFRTDGAHCNLNSSKQVKFICASVRHISSMRVHVHLITHVSLLSISAVLGLFDADQGTRENVRVFKSPPNTPAGLVSHVLKQLGDPGRVSHGVYACGDIAANKTILLYRGHVIAGCEEKAFDDLSPPSEVRHHPIWSATDFVNCAAMAFDEL